MPDENGDLHPIRTVGPGDYVGETALLLGAPSPETVVALVDCDVWALPAHRFDDLLCRYFDVGSWLEAENLERFGGGGGGTGDGEGTNGEKTPSRAKWLDIEVGEEAPDFILPSVQGHDVRLSEQRGRPVLLWFSRGYNCPFCREYMGRLTEALPQFEAAGVQILQVAPNLLESSRKFWATGTKRISELPFPFLCDPEKTAYLLCGLADLGASEANRNTVAGFAKAFKVGEGVVTCKAIALDVLNRDVGDRFKHHALTASQQAVFLLDAAGIIRRKFVFGPRVSGSLPTDAVSVNNVCWPRRPGRPRSRGRRVLRRMPTPPRTRTRGLPARRESRSTRDR